MIDYHFATTLMGKDVKMEVDGHSAIETIYVALTEYRHRLYEDLQKAREHYQVLVDGPTPEDPKQVFTHGLEDEVFCLEQLSRVTSIMFAMFDDQQPAEQAQLAQLIDLGVWAG